MPQRNQTLNMEIYGGYWWMTKVEHLKIENKDHEGG